MLAHIDLIDNAVSEAWQALAALSGQELSSSDFGQIPLMRSMQDQIQRGVRLQFILPAFPAKSPSSDKTHGISPDLGEVISLMDLNEMCAHISKFHAPGAEVIICSDGRVFSDVVGVDDKIIDHYSEGIDEIIKEFNLTHLSTFSMDSLHPGVDPDLLRERLLSVFAKSEERVRFEVQTDENTKNLFNGLHRFLMEDIKNPGVSRSQQEKTTKKLTYELMRRSDAWSSLLSHYFKGCLRLSIHPYPKTHEKFGIKLVSSSQKWATPWHNVTVKIGERFELMHASRAKILGAKEKMFKEKYVYFEI